MFFVRSSATLRRNEIERLEPGPRAPFNSPLSIQDIESSESIQDSSDNIIGEPNTSIHCQKNSNKPGKVRNIICKNEVPFHSSEESIKLAGDLKKPTFYNLQDSNVVSLHSIPRDEKPSGKFNIEHRIKSSQLILKNSSRYLLIKDKRIKITRSTMKIVRTKRYDYITAKVDTRRKKISEQKKTIEKRKNNDTQHCLATQTSTTNQNGSGDMRTEDVSSLLWKKEQDKLERFRRINMKIMEAVLKSDEYIPDLESCTETEDHYSELESLEEIEKGIAEEEQEEMLNNDALEACSFLEKNYPNYFQHLIKRYQLDIATTDKKELRMRKMDIIRIATEGDEKLGRLERMYMDKNIQNPVL